MTAYLMQLKTTSPRWGRIKLEVFDKDGDVGMAEIFNCAEK